MFGGQGDKKATSAEGVVRAAASSVLSHLPVLLLGVCCASSAHQAHPQHLLHRLPQASQPGSPATAATLELSIFSGPGGQRRMVASRASLRLGAASQCLSTLHFGLKLHWLCVYVCLKCPHQYSGLLKAPLGCSVLVC